MLLYIIRHGDPIYDPDSLTEKGRLQALALAKRLSVHGLDQIFVSPMIRAQQTAAPACELLHLTPQVEEWTSESLAWDDFACERDDGSWGGPFTSRAPVIRPRRSWPWAASGTRRSPSAVPMPKMVTGASSKRPTSLLCGWDTAGRASSTGPFSQTTAVWLFSATRASALPGFPICWRSRRHCSGRPLTLIIPL